MYPYRYEFAVLQHSKGYSSPSHQPLNRPLPLYHLAPPLLLSSVCPRIHPSFFIVFWFRFFSFTSKVLCASCEIRFIDVSLSDRHLVSPFSCRCRLLLLSSFTASLTLVLICPFTNTRNCNCAIDPSVTPRYRHQHRAGPREEERRKN